MIYKTVDVVLRGLQGRRVRCESCHTPFNLLHVEEVKDDAIGLPIVHSTEDMIRGALARAAEVASRRAARPRRGVAYCPRCRHLQGYMGRWPRLKGVASGAACGFVVGCILAVIAVNVLADGPSTTVVRGVTLAGGVLLALLLGFGGWSAAVPAPPAEGDPRAMTDAQLEQFLARCETQQLEPWTTWGALCGICEHPNEYVAALGFLDETGESAVRAS